MYDYNKSNKKQVKETVTTWSQNWLVPATQLVNSHIGFRFRCSAWLCKRLDRGLVNPSPSVILGKEMNDEILNPMPPLPQYQSHHFLPKTI